MAGSTRENGGPGDIFRTVKANLREVEMFRRIKADLGKMKEQVDAQKVALAECVDLLRKFEALHNQTVRPNGTAGVDLEERERENPIPAAETSACPAEGAAAAAGALEDLREKVRNLNVDLFLKGRALENLQAANTALIDQLKSRWTFVQALVSLVGFLFVINFGYQVYKTADVEAVGKDANAALTQLEAHRQDIVTQVNLQAAILAGMADGIVSLENGYKDANKDRYSLAARRAQLASEEVKTTFDQVVAESMHLRTEAARSADPQRAKEAIDLISPFRVPVEQLLMAAYNLEAYAFFKAGNAEDATLVWGRFKKHEITRETALAQDLSISMQRKFNMQRVEEVAHKMIDLDSKRWEGHHFLGLVLTDTGDANGAKKELIRSTELDTQVKTDIINLAELSFLMEQFPESKRQAEDYLGHDLQPPTELRLVARFFKDASTSLIDGKPDALTEFRTELHNAQRGFAKNYEFKNLENFAVGIRTQKYLIDKDYKQVRGPVADAIDDLIKRGTPHQ